MHVCIHRSVLWSGILDVHFPLCLFHCIITMMQNVRWGCDYYNVANVIELIILLQLIVIMIIYNMYWIIGLVLWSRLSCVHHIMKWFKYSPTSILCVLNNHHYSHCRILPCCIKKHTWNCFIKLSILVPLECKQESTTNCQRNLQGILKVVKRELNLTF